MSANGQHFGFFVEELPGELRNGHRPRNAEQGRPGLPWVGVPSSGVAYLAKRAGKPPEVLPQAPEEPAQASVLETVRYERQTYLTMLPAGEFRLNGLPLPPVAILRVGDQLRVGGRWLLHVSRFTRPHIGPTPEEFVGKQCSNCRLEFEATTVTYICPNCGTPVHCESEATKTSEELGPLECARLMSHCHHCHQRIDLKERYEYVPEC